MFSNFRIMVQFSMVQCFRTIVQFCFLIHLGSCRPLILLILQDFIFWFVEVPFLYNLVSFYPSGYRSLV
uniref:Uncharacterized protein n=1 Tax=Siphoviridae sp. ctaDn21 TaxID=2825563 RepID=A0A8S5UV13_9CAUD|nr:MAG TPA: hypothetical protein [Siphoviridae sp. ctaDn21]